MSDEQDKPKEPLSRRDFLRRAGKEAVDTGTKLVPGGNLARQALGMGATASTIPWWNVMAKWRNRNADSKETINTEEQDTGTDNG
jgi:hypothetical protein